MVNDNLYISNKSIILLLIVSILKNYRILSYSIERYSRFISNPPCLISSKLHSFEFSYSTYFLCAIHLPLTFWFIKSLISCNPITTAPSTKNKVPLNQFVFVFYPTWIRHTILYNYGVYVIRSSSVIVISYT